MKNLISTITLITSMFLCVTSCITNDSDVIKISEVMQEEIKQVNDSNYKITYMLDAACSNCIDSCIKFLLAYKKIGLSADCFIYLEEAYLETFKYYLTIYKVKNIQLKLIPLQSSYPYGFNIENGKVILMDGDNKIIKTLAIF